MDKDYFKQDKKSGAYFRRRRALFNVYGFPEHRTTRNATPELIIEGCHFEWFLGNYESLIYVETSTFWKVSRPITVFNTKDDPTDPSFTSFVKESRDFYFTSG